MTMIGLRELASNLARMQGWTNGWRNQSARAHGTSEVPCCLFQIEHPRANCRLALRINKAMCGPRISDSQAGQFWLGAQSISLL